MKRLFIVCAILLALGGAGVLAQGSTPTLEDIPLQEVEAGGRRYTVDPYELFECYIVSRTISLSERSDDAPLDMQITVQCFQRVGEAMIALKEVETRDFGISTQVAVGQAILSDPEQQQEGDPLDG